MSLKERKEMMAKQKKTRPKPEASSTETGSEPPSIEAGMDATQIISRADGAPAANVTYVIPQNNEGTFIKGHVASPAKPAPVKPVYTDYGLDDLGSGDETDEDDNPRKRVPEWASKEGLRQSVKTQYHRRVNHEDIFRGCYADKDRRVEFTEIFAEQLKDQAARMARINRRRETSVWDTTMQEPTALVDRTLDLDQSCYPPEEPRRIKNLK